jgi:hypothetical protein
MATAAAAFWQCRFGKLHIAAAGCHPPKLREFVLVGLGVYSVLFGVYQGFGGHGAPSCGLQVLLMQAGTWPSSCVS